MALETTSQNNTICVVIPARLHSTRLEKKLLLPVAGRPLICHTYEAAVRARPTDARVYVATDSDEIAGVVAEMGGHVVRTGPARSGTARVAQALPLLPDHYDIIVNVQADEPDIIPGSLQLLVDGLTTPVATLAAPITDHCDMMRSNVVKVVLRSDGTAMYFSRSPIPWCHPGQRHSPYGLRHIGIYAYRRSFLEQLSAIGAPVIGVSAFDNVEDLEQLEWLWAGWSMGVIVVEQQYRGIDTEDDYVEFRDRVEGRVNRD